jgi:hypothetical protein
VAVTSPTEGVTVAPGASTPAPGSYEAMCHHYCETLEQTNVYFCVSHGRGDLTGCAAQIGDLASQCEALRCAPKLVDPALCLTQCGGLAALYGPLCADAAGTPECPATPQAHDDACRAGCAVAAR